jgi:hypothetical protein
VVPIRSQGSSIAGAREPDCHTDLAAAAGWTSQELAERHEIGVGSLLKPLAANDELLTEIPKVRHGAAE